MRWTQEALAEVTAELGWDVRNDDLVIEIGGSSVSGINQGENYNEKWATPYGVRKYNKDAFIVIKNLTRSPFEPSQPNPDLKAHHLKTNKEKE